MERPVPRKPRRQVPPWLRPCGVARLTHRGSDAFAHFRISTAFGLIVIFLTAPLLIAAVLDDRRGPVPTAAHTPYAARSTTIPTHGHGRPRGGSGPLSTTTAMVRETSTASRELMPQHIPIPTRRAEGATTHTPPTNEGGNSSAPSWTKFWHSPHPRFCTTRGTGQHWPRSHTAPSANTYIAGHTTEQQ